MFGTLVVYLPAAYSGGQLLVYHRGDSQRFGSGELPPDVVSYAAFYADCEHEVKRVTSGYRWAAGGLMGTRAESYAIW